MTKEKLMEKLRTIDSSDPEKAHNEADCVLLEFLESNGFGDVALEWRELESRCGGFWYA